MKMRIVQIGPVPPPFGGVYANLRNIHELLISRGHSSAIVAVTDKDAVSEDDAVFKPRSAFELLRYLVFGKFDLVHYHIGGEVTVRVAALMLVCGGLFGKRSVITFHSGGYAAKAAADAARFSLRGFAFRAVDLVIGVNEQMLEMFRGFGVKASKMRLIPPYELRRPDANTSVPENIANFTAKHSPLIISVGGLEAEYGHSDAVAAFPEIKNVHENAGLLIAGSGSMAAELQASIASAGLENAVMLAGDIPHETLLKLMSEADVIFRITRFDGDAVSVREGLFLGTPVVATDNGMRPKGVILVPLKLDAKDLVNAVGKALNSPRDMNTQDDGKSNTEAVLAEYERLIGQR